MILPVLPSLAVVLLLAAPPGSPASRSSVLAEGWLFQPDPLEKGEALGWWKPDLDRTGWRRVPVPGAWAFYDPVMDGYEGVGWYALSLPGDRLRAGTFQRLRFGRVDHRATVWVNGRKAADDSLGYLPFDVPLTPWVQPGAPATVVVRVENGVRYDWLPGTTTVEWVQYGGLLQPVELVTTAPVRLEHVAIRALPRGDDGDIEVEVEVQNGGDETFAGRVRLEVDGREAVAATRIPARATGRVPLALRLPHAKRWSPDSPALYEARIRLLGTQGEIDALSERFGVRALEVKGRRILLNGAPLRLRGVNRYDELPGRGPVADPGAVRADLLAVKAMGANLVRVHYPQSPETLRIADEIGLLFMEEVPLNWWRAPWHPRVPPELDDDRIVDQAEQALERLLRRDGNHPSVIVWSVANECETADERGIRAMERLLRRAKALDPSRPVTYVANRMLEQNRAFALADLVAVNLYFGMWDGETAESLSEIETRVHQPTRRRLQEIAQRFPDKPILLSEFGTIGIPGSGGDVRFSETYQAAYLAAVWQAVREVPEVSGGIVWSWADYRHRRGFLNDFPAFFGPFGVVTLERREKAAYAALREAWARERDPGAR